MKVAIVYDRVNKLGGAERVLLALNKLFPDAPLYTSVYNEKKAKWAKVFKIKTSFLQSFPFAKSSHELYPLLMPLSFEQFNFDEYDLVISVTSEAAKGILTKPKTKHICYLLTPTRYLWSGYDDYFSNPILKFISKPAVAYLRNWDKVASQRPDSYIAISKTVKKRIEKYYNLNSKVIYPPLMLLKNTSFSNSDEGYYLIVSRLVSYKRIDLAIKACNKLNKRLIIIGVGSEEKKLKRLSGKTIEFKGSLSDQEVASYYRNCSAFIFPGSEDFGLTMVEAISFGKPVIAYKSGGATETIIDELNGIFFTSQTVTSLIEAINQSENKKWSQLDIINSSKKFSFESFKREFTEELSSLLA